MAESKVVLVTGATGGVGPVISRALAEKKEYRIALTGRSGDKLSALASSLDLPEEDLFFRSADLTDSDQVRDLVDAIAKKWGGVDILVNLAGGWIGGNALVEVSDEEWEASLSRNLKSAFLVCRAVLPRMVEKGWGRIVNFSSRAAERPSPRQAGYNVAKAGVVALTGSIAAEYRRRGISAAAIMPSIIDTPQNRESMPDADQSRWVTPASLAALVLFLLSEEGGKVSGAAIPVYGAM
jgi:NAD(P)-dependent dehydrogenase (short-subunit alcohol dehydrogenase family)